MFPDASIPVVQLSLDRTQNPAYHYALGQELRALRNRGVLIIGSGNIVHSFRGFVLADIAYDWAIEFDATIKDLIQEGNHKPIIEYQRLGRSAMLSVPTNEHYLPLLYTLSLQDQQDSVCFFNEKVSMGTMSMRSVWIG
jgi:4,5-DOPA dioxygenase extradiol